MTHDSERIQLHPTGLGLFDICGEAWRRRYEENEHGSLSDEIIVGSGVDVAIMADLLEKLKTGKLLSEADVLSIARDDVLRRRLKYSSDGLLGRTAAFVRYAHAKLCPSINVASVQHSWSVRLDKMLARRGGLRGKWKKIDLVGTLDIREHFYDFSSIDAPAGIGIRDIKTAGATPPKDAADGKHWTQLTTYALGEWVNTGKMPMRVQIDTLVSLKGGVRHVPSFGERDDFDFAALFNRIVRFAQARQAGIYHYAPRGHWKCTPQYCSFYHTCPATKNKHTIDLAPSTPRLYKITCNLSTPLTPASNLLEMPNRSQEWPPRKTASPALPPSTPKS